MIELKIKKRFVSLLTSCSLIIGIGGSVPKAAIPVNAADVCTIDLSVEYQNIRGFGGINLPEWVGSDLTDAQRQTAFGNGDDELGLTVLRVYVSDDSSYWQRAVPTALYAQKMGATIFATPWNPPASIRETGGGTNQTGKYHLPASNYGAYAQHLNDYYSYMKSQGVDLYSISIQNEPDFSKDWTGWTSDETTSFLANYGDQLNFRVMSPETFQYTNKDYYTKILNNSAAFENTDVFGTHFYGTQRSQMDFSALENSGKEIWMTEVYVPNSDADSANIWPDALDVSLNIHNGLVVGNMSVYTWWYIRRSYGLMTEDGAISKRGYCMAQYSKFVRPGDVRVDATEQPADNIYVSAYKNSSDQAVIVAINTGSEGYAQKFALSGQTISKVDRYRTSENESLAKTENLELTGTDGFYAQLPAKSVSTFVVSMDGGINNNEPTPDENGYYFHDTFEESEGGWTGHGSSDVALSGRSPYMDTNALLVQNRASAWNGTEKSLGSAFKSGSTYSFSVCAECLDADTDPQTFKLSLQYTNKDNETKYMNIATATTANGNYVQLANPSFTLPEGSGFIIYVETEGSTDNFYIDEAIGAVEGTVISGPAPVDAVTTTTTTPTETTAATSEPADTTTAVKPFLYGDANDDGEVNVADATLIMQAAAAPSEYSVISKEQADVTGGSDGVTAADALAIQKFLVGTIAKLPA